MKMVSNEIWDQLEDWLFENRIIYDIVDDHSMEIEDLGLVLIIDNGKGKIIGDDFSMIINKGKTKREELIGKYSQFVFKFGDNFYYSPVSEEKVSLNILKYVGVCDFSVSEPSYSNLGVRGKMEILNGSRDYNDWCKKAKFLEMKGIGLCEKNTLAGTLPFQLACQANSLKYVLGMTFDVELSKDIFRECKVYSLTQDGWGGLLRISKHINVDSLDKMIPIEELCKWGDGNVLVLGSASFDLDNDQIKKLKDSFDKVLYQLNSTEYKSDGIDKWNLENTKSYFNGLYRDVEPILISDSFYLDKDEADSKIILNKVDSGASHMVSNDQYFKLFEDHEDALAPLFEGSEFDYDEVMDLALDNVKYIVDEADVIIDMSEIHLPEYEMTEEEKEKYGTIEELFEGLLDEAYDKLTPEGKDQEYDDRLSMELDVIYSGGFVNYFLILWDIIKSSEAEGIQVGNGRGSAAGSLCAYFLGITKLDPIEYDLLFERFLNSGRLFITVSKEFVEVDVDGTLIEYNSDKLIKVIREGKSKKIRAKNLIEGDKIDE